MAEPLSWCPHHAMTLLQGPTTALLPTTRSSFNSLRATKSGLSLHISSPMSFVMSCLTMSVWQKDLTTGFKRLYANCLRYSPSDAWPRDGHQVLRIPIGPITGDNLPVMPRTVSPKKSVDYQWARHSPIGCSLKKRAYVKTVTREIRTQWSPTPSCRSSRASPWGWNAIHRLPDSSAMFKDYLREWHSLVEPLDRPFVKRILGLFED